MSSDRFKRFQKSNCINKIECIVLLSSLPHVCFMIEELIILVDSTAPLSIIYPLKIENQSLNASSCCKFIYLLVKYEIFQNRKIF